MKVLLFGHSYVGHLRDRIGNWDRSITVKGEQVDLEFSFLSYPGKDFDHILDNPWEFNEISFEDPDAIIVIFGGNLLTEAISDPELKGYARSFFTKLRDFVRPNTKVLAAQIEPRFNQPGNFYGAVTESEWKRRRTVYNNYLNKKLRRDLKLVDHLVLFGSNSFLSEDRHLRGRRNPGVHLTDEGLLAYQSAVLGALQFALE